MTTFNNSILLMSVRASDMIKMLELWRKQRCEVFEIHHPNQFVSF
jgi:hypothetical protein